MSQQRQILLTAAIGGAFTLMLAGTSKDPVDEKPAAEKTDRAGAEPPKGIPAPDEPAGIPPAVLPDTTGWERKTLEAAGISVQVPKGTTLDPAGSGNDKAFSGRFFNLTTASGYEVNFAQNTGSPVDLAEKKTWYQENASGFAGFVFEAADALVASRNEGPPAGDYWETTVCSVAIDGKPLCVSSAGASIDMDGSVTKLTHDEALALIAIARSIQPVP